MRKVQAASAVRSDFDRSLSPIRCVEHGSRPVASCVQAGGRRASGHARLKSLRPGESGDSGHQAARAASIECHLSHRSDDDLVASLSKRNGHSSRTHFTCLTSVSICDASHSNESSPWPSSTRAPRGHNDTLCSRGPSEFHRLCEMSTRHTRIDCAGAQASALRTRDLVVFRPPGTSIPGRTTFPRRAEPRSIRADRCTLNSRILCEAIGLFKPRWRGS